MAKNKVLILLDGSEFRRRILPYVQRFLRSEDNELLLFRVAERPETLLYLEGGIYYDRVFDASDREAITEQIREEMLETKQLLEDAGYEVQRAVRFGGVATEIEKFIATGSIDMVAMTTHGRGSLGKLLYGSIAEHLIQTVNIPIMLLRAEKE